MFVQEILIRKSGSIDTQLSRSIVIDEIPALNHEIFHDSMKSRIFVSSGLLVLQELSRTKLPKVFTSLGTLLS